MTTSDTVASDNLVLRSNAALGDVHSFALAELEKVEARLIAAKHAIETKRDEAQAANKAYVEMVRGVLTIAGELNDAVANVARLVAGDASPRRQLPPAAAEESPPSALAACARQPVPGFERLS